MIDGIKILINSRSFADELIDNPLLQFFTPTDHKSGEFKTRCDDEYKGLRIAVYESGRVYIRGSLHKYFNQGHHNHNDFSFRDMIGVLEGLEQKFNINLMAAKIETFELGVNLKTPFSPSDFIENVLAFKGSVFNRIRGKDENRIECWKQQYGIKIYDKGKQYRQDENILRIELKIRKMKFIKSTEIFSIADFKKLDKMNALKGLLIKIVSDIVMNDKTVNINSMTAKKRLIYHKCSDPLNWVKFTRRERYRKKNQLEAIIKKHGTTNWIDVILPMINTKCNQLLKKEDVLTSMIKG